MDKCVIECLNTFTSDLCSDFAWALRIGNVFPDLQVHLGVCYLPAHGDNVCVLLWPPHGQLPGVFSNLRHAPQSSS